MSLVEALHALADLHSCHNGHVYVQYEQRDWLEFSLSPLSRSVAVSELSEHFFKLSYNFTAIGEHHESVL